MKKKIQLQQGFTLLELLVVIALMGIIYSVTLSNYNGMNKSIELQNTAYNVALSIRESQVYGINKKLASGEFSDGDPFSFGIHIDLDNKTEIITFEDRDVSGNTLNKMDQMCTSIGAGGRFPSECEGERKIIFKGGNHISALWLDGVKKTSGKKINIMFKRPNPDAKIIDDFSDTIYSRIGIELSSQDGETYKSCVEIGSAGDMTLKGQCD